MKKSVLAISIALATYAAGSMASTPVFTQPSKIAGQHAFKATVSGMKNQYDRATGLATFQWAGVNQAKPDLSNVPNAQRLSTAADFYLSQIYNISVDKNAPMSAVISKTHNMAKGAKLAKFQQQVFGVEVFNREVNIMMNDEFDLVASSGYLAPSSAIRSLSSAPISLMFAQPERAVKAAFKAAGGDAADINIAAKNQQANFTNFAVTNNGDKIIVGSPRTKPVFFEANGELIAGHYVEVEIAGKDDVDSEMYNMVIDAQSGKVLFKNNLKAHAADFTYRVHANESGYPWDSPNGNVIPALPGAAEPTAFLTAPLVTLKHGPISTKDVWLADDAQETIGYNVKAYVDAIAPDGLSDGDYTANITSANTFDHVYDASQPEYSMNNRKAAIVNLFYLNNFLHDWFYDHGFDEAAGNAQSLNYGRGGVEGDPVRAEVQDFSGTNNANMSTPADGRSPRMQMYLWDSKDAVNGTDYGVTVEGDIGALDVVQRASFGQGQFDVSGDIVVMEDITAPTTNGCEASNINLAGKIVLIDRGVCAFTIKAKNAQDAGAIAVLVANSANDGTPAPMGGTDATVKIPSMGINFADGAALKDAIAAGRVSLRMFNNKPFKSSSWDAGIVAHEWGHYISNRLVGNSSGLINNQGRSMGEGWGDFHALLLLADAKDVELAGNDQFQLGYSATSYVASFSEGIRHFPYSTDREVNPLTFANVTMDGAEVHSAGEPWAQMLWDCFVSLVNDDRYTFEQARGRMMDYLVAGYKMTPIAPTYTEARDAILAAAYATDMADYQLLVKAFADRGMGLTAESPDRYSTDHSGVVESDAVTASSFVVNDTNFNRDFEGLTNGYCTKDGVIDNGETATVSFDIQNTGSEVLTNIQAQLTVVSGPAVEFANEGKFTISELKPYSQVATVPVQFKVTGAKAADDLVIAISFPDLPEGVIASPDFSHTKVNYDFADKALVANSSTADMEDLSALEDFKERVLVGGDMAKGTVMVDDTYADYFDGNYLLLTNQGFRSDVVAETKAVTVGFAGDFTISFMNYYELEEGYDGGVVEVSINGSDWLDVTEVGGVMAHGYNSELAEELPGRMTYTGYADYPAVTETINFGTKLNGNEVKFRFRVVSDTNTSWFGWVVDNVAFTNITNSVFHTMIAGDSVACDNRLPTITSVAASAGSVTEGGTVTLTAAAVDANASDALTYAWTQVSGPAATIAGADTNSATVTLPQVSSDTDLVFAVAVNDGTGTVTQQVTVKVTDVPPPPPPANTKKASGSFGGVFALLLLPMVWLRRRNRR